MFTMKTCGFRVHRALPATNQRILNHFTRSASTKSAGSAKNQNNATTTTDQNSGIAVDWLRDKLPYDFWNDLKKQREFFDWVGNQKGFKTQHDWYSIKQSDIIALGGAGLLKLYNNTLTKAIVAVYPEMKWKVFMFNQVPAGYWDDPVNIKEYMLWLSDHLGIQTMEDWYNVSYIQVSKLKGGTLLGRFGGLYELLRNCFPGHSWDPTRFSRSNWGKTESLLLKYICDIFEAKDIGDIYTDYSGNELLYQSNQKPMKLDIYIPDLKIAFEYLGEQHYKSHNLFGSPEERQSRDVEKREKCQEVGITLIEVPYWWDRRSGSLLATIHQQRPDIVSKEEVPRGAFPIMSKRPSSSAKGKGKPKEIDQDSAVQESLMMCLPWSNKINPTGWWMSEKYGGIRACWDSKQQVFTLPNGVRLSPPQPFVDSLLQCTSSSSASVAQLDGELWLGYKKRSQLMERLPTPGKESTMEWSDIKYMIFDIILNDTTDETSATFEQRLQHIAKLNVPKDGTGPIGVVEHRQCQGYEDLNQVFNTISQKGGDGVMLRMPKSLYEHGKSTSLLKVKFFEGKAKVVAQTPTSITCLLPSNVTFGISLTTEQQKQYSNQQLQDEIISFRHSSGNDWHAFSPSQPTNPILSTIRKDLSWEEVLEESTPFYLAVGKKKGTPKCTGCRVDLKDREQYRIQLKSILYPQSKQPRGTVYQFCPKSECVQKALQDSNNTGTLIPPFDGHVYVDPLLELHSVNLRHCAANGIKFVSSRQIPIEQQQQ